MIMASHLQFNVISINFDELHMELAVGQRVVG